MSLSPKAIFGIGLGLLGILAGFNLLHGYHTSDDGFVLAFAWRVWNGEIPHRDFISIRPPLTPLLHQIWMILPERLQFPAARLSFYLWLGAIWWVGALRLLPALLRDSPRWLGTAVAVFSAFWLYSIHNFPATPWHTTDGMMLSTLSLFLLVEALIREERGERRLPWLWFLSAFGAGLAPFTKQSFAPTPILYLAIVALAAPMLRRRKNYASFAWPAAIGLLAGPLSLLIYLWSHGAWEAYSRQIAAASDPQRFLSLAVFPYLHVNRYKIIGLVLGVVSAAALFRFRRSRAAPWLFLVPALAVALRSVSKFDRAFYHSSVDLFRFVIAWTLVVLILSWKNSDRRASSWGLGLGSLAVTWMTSISLGYNFPILGFSVLGVFVAVAIREFAPPGSAPPPVVRTSAATLAAGMLIYVIVLDYHFPFRDASRPELRHDLAQIYPKFGPKLMTQPETFAQVSAARRLSEKYAASHPNRPLIVFPEFPLFYYLSGRRSEFPLDWFISIDYPGYEAQLKERLREMAPIVLFQLTDSRARSCEETLYPSDPITEWILRNSRILERDGPYCVLEVGANPV